MDDDYQAVGSHLDPLTIKKIKEGSYVDFIKLLPKERLEGEEEEKMELVNRGESFGFVSSIDRERRKITLIFLWDTAFRVYSKIFTQSQPGRSSELVEYSHNIHTIAETYTWKNVYQYDKEFRLHMEKHPDQNLGVILQRAWSLYLKDKIPSTFNGEGRTYRGNDSQSQTGKKGKICYKYNGGKCTYRFGCKFLHKCGVCNKFGHGAHICWRVSGRNKSKDIEDKEDSRRSKC